MNCVILAAGLGTRLRGVSQSKPLTPLAGAPLIEHVVRRAAAGGASRFVVVTGHEAARVEEALDGIGERLGVGIEWVRVADWTRPNGYSALAGSERVDAPYLLMMADHLFDPEIVRRLVAGAGDTADVVLAVDAHPGGEMIDLDDATKVAVAPDGRIERIGKELESYNAIDTGVFVAGPGLAQAIMEDIAGGGPGSLSAGVQRLADAGRARTVDIGRARWIDVDDARMLALAEAWLAADRATDCAASRLSACPSSGPPA
jgi:1L-myo-inositol 1-phosphate cytidylyltransferase